MRVFTVAVFSMGYSSIPILKSILIPVMFAVAFSSNDCLQTLQCLQHLSINQAIGEEMFKI